MRWLKLITQALALGVVSLAFFIATLEFPEFGKLVSQAEGLLKWAFLLAAFIVGLGLSWRSSSAMGISVFAFGFVYLLFVASIDMFFFGVEWLDTLLLGTPDGYRIALGYGLMLGALTAMALGSVLKSWRPLSGKS